MRKPLRIQFYKGNSSLRLMKLVPPIFEQFCNSPKLYILLGEMKRVEGTDLYGPIW